MIIVFSGPAGSGKDTAANYLAKKLNLPHVSGGDILRKKLSDVGLDPRKEVLGDFGIFIRKHYGTETILRWVLAQAGENGLVASGLRSPAEADAVHKNDGILIYIDAVDDVRYQRIITRARGGDPKDIAEIANIDQKEFNTSQSFEQNLDVVREKADAVIVNNSSLNDLYHELDGIIDKYA